MKGDDILILENQINILEKESKILEEAYNQKNKKKFNNSKNNILYAYKRIKRIIK